MKPSLKLIGATQVTGRMEQLRKRVPNASLVTMRRGCELLRGYIVKKKLSGQVLKVRTNALRGGMTYEVTQQKDMTIGKIGPSVKYGRVHELGINQDVKVKAHTRTIKMAFGRNIPSQDIWVSAHSRRMKIPAKHYIGNSMSEIRPALQKLIGKDFFAEVISG